MRHIIVVSTLGGQENEQYNRLTGNEKYHTTSSSKDLRIQEFDDGSDCYFIILQMKDTGFPSAKLIYIMGQK